MLYLMVLALILDVNGIAIVVPIHRKHFDYLERFVNDVNGEVDVYVIFSNNADLTIFQKRKISGYIPLIYSNLQSNIISQKKFYGLQQAANAGKYTYAITIDAESTIIKKNFNKQSLFRAAESYFENKKIFSGKDKIHVNHRINHTLTIFKNQTVIEAIKNLLTKEQISIFKGAQISGGMKFPLIDLMILNISSR
jgi:hypothetical protein